MSDGVLIAHVYRHGPWVRYLDHAGAHPDMLVDADLSPGGEWEDAQVLLDQPTPMPPRENGLWEMRYPWRNAVHRSPAAPLVERDDMDYDDDVDDPEVCCVYTAEPTWTLLVPGLGARAAVPSAGEPAP